MEEVERQDAEQQENRAHQGVEEELDGGVELAAVSPNADDEIHRHQHDFPENVEEEEVERHEDAQHAGLEQHEHDVVFAHALLNGRPGGKHGNKAQHGSQHNQQEADAVDAQVEAGADGRNPFLVDFELETGRFLVKPKDQRQGNQETGQHDAVGPPAHQVLASAGNQQQYRRAHQGRKQNPIQDVFRRRNHHLTSSGAQNVTLHIVKQEQNYARGHPERVALHHAGLEHPRGPIQRPNQPSQRIDRAVHNPGVPPNRKP